MANTIEKIEELINSKVKSIFMQNGFKYKKKNNSFIRNNSNMDEFRIDIKCINGRFNIHLILAVYNNSIGLLREAINDLIPNTEQFLYLSKTMKSSMKKNNSLLADLTDWKSLDTENELHIWFESFNDINNISNMEFQLNKSVELGLSWFKLCEDFNYLIQYNIDRGLEYTIETALLLLYYQNNLAKLNSVYEKIILERKQKKLNVSSIEKFYNALNMYIGNKKHS